MVVTGYSTGYSLWTLSRWQGSGGDNSAALSVARLEIWQVEWYPSWPVIGDVLPGFGIREMSVVELFTVTVIQLQALESPCWDFDDRG